MKKFPAQFSDLLSRQGLKLLEGRHPLAGTLARGQGRFVFGAGLLDARRSVEMAALLEKTLGDKMVVMAQPIPPEATAKMTIAYTEQLPKTVRVHTAFIDHARSAARKRAVDSGLIELMRSSSFHAFAEALSGYPLRNRWGLQALCYRDRDYSGPHNDAHPDEPLGKDGYTDLHLTFCNDAVERQLLVYEKQGHLTELTDVAMKGGVTCYRLPFWHYTTPLQSRRGKEKASRRWVLLGTFLDRWDD